MSLYTFDLAQPRSQTAECQHHRASLRDVASLLGITLPAAMPAQDRIGFAVRRVEEGHALYRSGEAFRNVYVVRFGFFKTAMAGADGTEQIVAFPMKADLLGLDGLGSGAYGCEAIALEMSEVIVLPFEQLTELAAHEPALLAPLLRILGRELARENAVIFKLASMHAEARVATFLIELAERYGALGYSQREFQLRMKRQEIGSFLGLKLETVSRTLSALDAARIIEVRKKSIVIRDAARLHACAEGEAAQAPTPVKATVERLTSGRRAWSANAADAMAMAAA